MNYVYHCTITITAYRQIPVDAHLVQIALIVTRNSTIEEILKKIRNKEFQNIINYDFNLTSYDEIIKEFKEFMRRCNFVDVAIEGFDFDYSNDESGSDERLIGKDFLKKSIEEVLKEEDNEIVFLKWVK